MEATTSRVRPLALMSRAAKATLIASIVVSSLTVWGVHYLQQQEHDVCASPIFLWTLLMRASQTMYQGVLRDDERRKRKMKERDEDLLRSQRKREIYESVQQVENIVQVPDSDTRGS
jgi:protein PET117